MKFNWLLKWFQCLNVFPVSPVVSPVIIIIIMCFQHMEARCWTMRHSLVNSDIRMLPYGQQSAASRSRHVTSVPAEALHPCGSTNRWMGKANLGDFGLNFDRPIQSEQRVCECVWGWWGFLLLQKCSMISAVAFDNNFKRLSFQNLFLLSWDVIAVRVCVKYGKIS